ncbi:hypothetical protein AB0H83_37505 [Dactylosporangium sp. NPDC050688]|uniref:hypothetical protein n=1 Tax=Dactylosporangium sp. NPDC050688 TaxID=3157217 RepID=UPI0033E7BB0F
MLLRRRTHALVDRIAGLGEEEADRLLRQTLARFDLRHRDLEDTFRQHYEMVRHRVCRADELSPAGRLLVGAYFSHEYAVEAAALCNPSVVEHPDQSAMDDGQLRVAISLRQIGEGHLSSVGFATAVIGPAGRLAVADRSGPLVVGRRTAADHRRDLLAAGMTDEGEDNEISAGVLDGQSRWSAPVPLRGPRRGWELIQIGQPTARDTNYPLRATHRCGCLWSPRPHRVRRSGRTALSIRSWPGGSAGGVVSVRISPPAPPGSVRCR